MPKKDQRKKCERCGGAGVEPDEIRTGDKFRALRKQAGITIYEMAEKMRISSGHLSTLENGKRHWRPDMIESFQRNLGILSKT